MERKILEPHGEPKYLAGPDGVLSYRITSDKLTRDNPDRANLWARIEADVLVRNEVHPVDMYTWAKGEREDGSEFEDLVRVRFDENWTVVSIEQVA